MSTKLDSPVSLSLDLASFTELLARYQDTRQTLKQLSPKLLQSTELKELLNLGKPIESLLKQGYLYKCTTCGELKITTERLKGDSLVHVCDRATLRHRGKLSRLVDESENLLALPLGTLELVASGPIEDLLLWSHSIQLGLDNPLKGI